MKVFTYKEKLYSKMEKNYKNILQLLNICIILNLLIAYMAIKNLSSKILILKLFPIVRNKNKVGEKC